VKIHFCNVNFFIRWREKWWCYKRTIWE